MSVKKVLRKKGRTDAIRVFAVKTGLRLRTM